MSPRFEAYNGGQVVPEPRWAGRTACTAGKDRDRAARFAQPPAAQVEKMDRFFERPASHTLRVIAPPGGAGPVGTAPDINRGVLRRPHRALLDQGPHAAPLRRMPQFVPDV